MYDVGTGYVHLRIEEAGWGLDNADSLVVDWDGIEGVFGVLQDSHELQAQILGMELSAEGVGHRLLSAGGNLQRVALGGEVAHNLALTGDLLNQRTADKRNANGRWLVVGDGQTRFGDMAVDELDAENLRLGERDGDGDLEVRRLGSTLR